MTARYIRSTDGNNADDGSTWALAKATLAGVDAIDTAGDDLWVSQSHAESTAGAITLTFAGTLASPQRLLCGNDAAEPPTALATTATVTTTGSNAIAIGGGLYAYGISFISGNAITLSNSGVSAPQTWDTCSFQTTNTGSAGVITLAAGNNNTYKTTLKNCTFKFGATSQTITLGGDSVISGGSVLAGGTTPTSLFVLKADRTSSSGLVEGFDFSNLTNTFNLCGISGIAAGKITFRNCKLPASWSGVLVAAGIPAPGQRFEMFNCDATDTNYRMWVEDYAGSAKSETTIVRSSGASDGTTALSWKLSTSANAKFPLIRFESPEIAVWVDSTGSKTFTVEIVHDTNVAAGQGAGASSAFQDDEWWLEGQYYGNGSFPVSSFVSDCKADVLAAAADQTSSSVTWTTTGLTTPVKQKLNFTVTVNEKGYVLLKIIGAKASKTIYACPKVDVT